MASRTIAEKMRQRRQKMEATYNSDIGSYHSDVEDIQDRNVAISGNDVTEIQSLDNEETSVQDEGDDMIEAMQTRRQQRKEELMSQQQGSSSVGEWASTPATSSHSRPPLPRSIPSVRMDRNLEQPGDKRSEKAPSQRFQETVEAATRQAMEKDGKQIGGKLNASVKERLRSRVRGIQAKMEEKEGLPERKFRGLRELPIPHRFQDTRADDDDYDPHLKASMASAREWSKLRVKQKTAHGMPTEEEAYNFFTGTGMSLQEEAAAKDKEDPKPAQVPGEVSVELFDDVALTSWQKLPYIPTRERLEKEGEVYSHPSVIPAAQESKVPAGMIPRCLEDEGFYVGKPPTIGSRQLNVMENRVLLASKDDFSWFDEYGVLKRLPDPIRPNPTRFELSFAEDINPALETFWGKAEVSTFDGRYISGNGAGRRFQLDVDISTLSFTHHPLFSKEHVLVSRLQQLYNQYCARVRKGFLEHLIAKLSTLRDSLVQLQEVPDSSKKKRQSAVALEIENRKKFYKSEIKKIRRQRDEEEYRERMLLKNIFKCWQDVKRVRELQGYTNTPLVLKIIRQVVNKADEQRLRQNEIQEELQDLREEYEEHYQESYANYETQMQKWKKQMKLKKRKAQKRLEQTQIGPDTLHESPDESDSVPPPQRPPEFNEDEAMAVIEKKMRDCRRRPGEAILTPELQSGANLTPTEQCSKDEQRRRSDMKHAKYFIKVMFNNQEVSRTATKPLTSEFTIHFGEILNMQVLQWPESITLQIFDAVSWPNALMSELFVPIPEASMLSGTVENEAFEFSSDHYVSYKHSGVGSGVKLDLNLSDDGDIDPAVTLLTSGILYSSVAWGIDEQGKPLAPQSKSHSKSAGQGAIKQRDALSALGAAGVIDMEMLISWINEANLDPNDPSNADILNLANVMNSSQKDPTLRPKYFRLNQLEEETDFATNEELDNCKRFRLIQLREQGEPEFKNLKLIPSEDKYIPDSIFDAYEKRMKGDEPVGEADGEMSHRARVANFLVKARKNVLARSQIAKRQLDLTDVVIEDEVPDIGTLGIRLAHVFAKRHPLKPERKERKRIGGQNLSTVKQVKILINIARAFDVPIRVGSTQQTRQQTAPARSLPGPSESMASAGFSASGRGLQASYSSRMSVPQGVQQQTGYNLSQTRVESLVRPFVEVVFQGNFIRTCVADGPLPNWNEELVVPFRAPENDYSTENLQKVKENIYINLFDEVVIDILQDERQRGTNIHQRTEKYWLGSIEIPFATVYFNSKVKGLMRVNSPPVLLGYQSSKSSVITGSQSGKSFTYLQLFVTIEPQLQPAQPIAEIFETNESETLVHNAQVWLSATRSQHPGREYKTMVSDLNGKKVFATRYIRPQSPPGGLISDASLPKKQVMRILARYVSLIPYIPDSVQFPDLCDIWTTSEQFLSMLAGDEEEHAVLLCNFFLSIGSKAWVVLGNGIPEGSTAYVLSEDGLKYQLWNASNGECYEISDVRCPLQSIGCLIDENNILGNVQKEDHPSKLDMNMANPKLWKPFFSRNYPNPGLSSVQLEQLNYHESDAQYFINLQDKIERLLKEKLMDWRPRFPTRLNRFCNQAFRNLLTSIEQSFAVGASIDDHNAELQQVISSYKLTGFPLQMPYTDIQPILDAVFSTGVHNCEDPDVEFALAVHIHPYPNSVVAVWVYVGRLVKKITY